jgi:hypothetical protein
MFNVNVGTGSAVLYTTSSHPGNTCFFSPVTQSSFFLLNFLFLKERKKLSTPAQIYLTQQTAQKKKKKKKKTWARRRWYPSCSR